MHRMDTTPALYSNVNQHQARHTVYQITYPAAIIGSGKQKRSLKKDKRVHIQYEHTCTRCVVDTYKLLALVH